VQTSGDDRYLYHAVIGRGPGSLGPSDTGSAKMVYVLDIGDLLAAGTGVQCNIDRITEVYDGGDEADCPDLVDVLEVPDNTSGGPHWGALDNFERQSDGTYVETRDEQRLAVSNYFVSRSGVDGNHKVCMVDIADSGELAFDRDFIDENEGTPCIDFNRTVWPHGAVGAAKPHSQLFVVRNDRIVGDSPLTAASTSDASTTDLEGAAAASDETAAEATATTEAATAAAAAAAPASLADDVAASGGALVDVTATPASSSPSGAERTVPWALAAAAAALAASVAIGSTSRLRRRDA
jgi:hypothetical protein